MKNHQLAPTATGISENKPASNLSHYSISGNFGKRVYQEFSKRPGIKTAFAVLICFLIFTITSCKKDVIHITAVESRPSLTDRDIYIAGYNHGKVIYWKNGIEHLLCTSEWSSGDALGIAVSGKDVYVVGRRNNNAVYWKNGVEVSLTTDSTGIEEATAITINGN
ncbi:MAG TPA: hypothetical protein VEZ17_05325, partial [Chitinophagaceae bacterium]|nr:hypothetical protein [Chitinophagaceae bacterium]